MSDRCLWGLHHAGDRDLLAESVVAIGWAEAGDLGDLPDEREAFKEHLRIVYSTKPEAWIANAAGQLLRFRHRMRIGDGIVYPRKRDRTINIGRIEGDYAYRPRASPAYPQQRKVEWLKAAIPRDSFSPGCLHELGASMSVFAVKAHRDELLAASPPGTGAASAPAAPTACYQPDP
jgi:predicted Mrr-cat superfamily restriction endonuclease